MFGSPEGIQKTVDRRNPVEVFWGSLSPEEQKKINESWLVANLKGYKGSKDTFIQERLESGEYKVSPKESQ